MKFLVLALALIFASIANAGSLAQCKVAMHSLAKKYPQATIEYIGGGNNALWIRDYPKTDAFTADRDTVYSVCFKQGLRVLYLAGSGDQPKTICTTHLDDSISYHCSDSESPLTKNTPRANLKDGK